MYIIFCLALHLINDYYMPTKIFTPYNLGPYRLANRMIMAPMTRSRAIGNIPNDLMAAYYAQRATAGLIISEGVAPSPNGSGYPRIPGIYSDVQVEAWKKVTTAVHANGGHIFTQLMHTGRIGHPDNLPPGARLQAPSSVVPKGQIYTDTSGMQPYPQPDVLTTAEVKALVQEHVQAALNAEKSGFDGVELHGAHGYLIEQFLNPHTNTRTDEYGGSVENRSRFALETAAAVTDAIGKDKIGIRLSPFNVHNDQQPYDQDLVRETYRYLAAELDKIGILYLHISVTGPVQEEVLDIIREEFSNTLIRCGSLDADSAERLLEGGNADLVAFGRPFLANPDLVKRFQTGHSLNQPDATTFFTPYEEGFIDYPTSLQI
jgi:N-ethylmaleimide reductase